MPSESIQTNFRWSTTFLLFSPYTSTSPLSKIKRPGAGFVKPLRLTGLDFLTNECISLPALVRKSSLGKVRGFVIPAPGPAPAPAALCWPSSTRLYRLSVPQCPSARRPRARDSIAPPSGRATRKIGRTASTSSRRMPASQRTSNAARSTRSAGCKTAQAVPCGGML